MKKVCLLTLFMATLLAAQVHGQVSFSGIKIIDSTQYVSGAQYMVDLDGDQDADLLSSSYTDRNVAWYEQDADHNFVQKHIILPFPPNSYISAVAPVDMDQDGDMDLVVIIRDATSKISWYENDGAGHFPNNHAIGVVLYECYQFELKDLDRDGDLDIILGNHTSLKEINWLENYGGNHFGQSENLISDPGSLNDFVVADLDGIENLEILYTVNTDYTLGRGYVLHCVKKDETGAYASDQILEDSLNSASAINIADWDQDNIPDIQVVKGSNLQYKIIWLKNDGNADFGNAIYFPTTANYLRIKTGDFDGDGDNDLISVYSEQNYVLFLNNGPGASPTAIAKTIDIDGFVGNIFVNDDDGDQNLDLIVTNFYYIARLKNSGDAQFDTGKKISYEGPRLNSASMVDFDGDGKKDIVSGYGYESCWYKNLGNNQFSSKNNLLSDSLSVQSFFADLDHDNDLDLIRVTDLSYSSMAWYKNDGANHFSLAKTLNTGISTQFTTVTDYDGDGDIDIIYYTFSTILGTTIRYINAYRNNGTGGFSAVQLINLGSTQITQFHIADLDGDQKQDIYYRDYDHKLVWYKNDGVGHFTNQTVIGVTSSYITNILAADMDHDGDVDLFYGNYGEPNFYLYKNDGLGNFTDAGSQTLDIPNYYVNDLKLADLDHDGDMDVIIAGNTFYPGKGGVLTIENSGDGTLTSPERIFSQYSWSIDIDDFDSDGDLDIIGVDYDDPVKLAWFENLAPVATKSPTPAQNALALAPNPAATETTLTIDLSNLSASYLVEIQDMNGNTVSNYQSREQVLNVQRNNLPAGTYIVQVREAQSGKLLGVKKLIWK